MPAPSDESGIPLAPRLWLVPTLTALAALGAYLLTLSSEVGTGDAAELTLQAVQLGVTHPPGYPVYVALGKLFTLVVSDPARATHLLSAVATAVATGLLCGIGTALTHNRTASVLASLMFAFLPTIWDGAVTTEVYNVNVCLVALTTWLLLRGEGHGEGGDALIAGVVAGLSLGTGLANVLLLPGMIWLLWQRRRSRPLRVLGWVVLVAAIGAATIGWTVIRSRTMAPLGTTYAPDTLPNALRYLRGRQYLPVELPALRFFADRLSEHAGFWLASFLWIGAIPGLAGLGMLWRRRRGLCLAFLLMFAGNWGTFTFHPWRDYREMVAPSYLIFAAWTACGLAGLFGFAARVKALSAATVAAALLVAALGVSGLRAHFAEAQQTPVTDFVRASFAAFPQDAVVAAEWATFTPMLCFQQLGGLRPDLTLVERAEQPRHYRWGQVGDWRQFVYDAARTRPVIVDVMDEALARWASVQPFHPPPWYRITILPPRP